MRVLTIDGAGLQTVDDAYSALFPAWEAPTWHGRNFNALRDSLLIGSINAIEPPFLIVVCNSNRLGPGAKQLLKHFDDLLHEIREDLRSAAREIEIRFS